MRTTLYLIRHAATAANLAHPAKLQGRRSDLPLDPVGIHQAALTRDFLAIRSFSVCYTSPLRRAKQTAEIIAAPHGLTPLTVDALTECDVGRWEGQSWEEIKQAEPELYKQYMSNPGIYPYAGGESFGQVYQRARKALDALMEQHVGENLLVVSHHIVNRTYLAGVLGLDPGQARAVSLENCSISIVVREGSTTTVSTLNAAFHLAGSAA